jgi:hypothetical protein
MSRLIALAVLVWSTCPVAGWQGPAAKPNFSGSWQIDAAKSKPEIKDDLVWKIDHKDGTIAIDETAVGKSLCNAKCSIGKPCDFEAHGKKMTAMTYFLDTTLVQMRSASDNSSVVKWKIKMDPDGSMKVEQITIVPADKSELLVFRKKGDAGAKPVVVSEAQKR